MDALSQLAEYWSAKKQNDDAESQFSPGVLKKLMASRAPASEASKPSTNLKMDEIAVTVGGEKPPAAPENVQDMSATEIQADHVKGPEDKFKVLNRIIKMSEMAREQVEDPESKGRILGDIQSTRARALEPRQKLDLSDLENPTDRSRRDAPEWSQSDYVKAALIATLPALAGGLAGGLAGAAGGAPAGAKGIEWALKDQGERRRMKDEKGLLTAANRINAYKAETDARGKDISTMAELSKLETETLGKLSKPTQDFIKKALEGYVDSEVDLQRNEVSEFGDTTRKGLDLDQKDLEGEQDRTFRGEQGEKSRGLTKDIADKNRFSRENTADDDREALLNYKGDDRGLKKDIFEKELDFKKKKQIQDNALAQKKAAASGKSAGLGKPPNDGMRLSAGYSTRMVEANDNIDEFGKTDSFDATSARQGITDFLPQSLKNWTRNPDAQRYHQAVENFLTANLRKESGAAISDQETANATRQYFPVAGDSPENIAQKRQNRKTAIAAMKAGAGTRALSELEEARGPKEQPQTLDPIEQYARKYKMPYPAAKKLLEERGLQIGPK